MLSAAKPKPVTVWITRTDASAPRSVNAIKRAGFTPLNAPLLKLTVASTPAAAPPEDSALAFTSLNGVKAFAALTDRRNWPVFAVGKTTAKSATEAGFDTVFCANADVDALADLIIAHAPDDIVHVSGVHVAGDLVSRLEEAGLKARRIIIYGTDAVTALPDAALAALETDASETAPLAVFLYSPKGARAFISLMQSAERVDTFKRLNLISISPAVDAVLGTHVFKSRLVADAPNEPAMIAALELMSG